jgi:hypothetical protein
MRSDLTKLSKRIRAATGRDRELDKSIADPLEHSAAKMPEYNGSVAACIDWVRRVLPAWSWLTDYGPGGVLPYAAVSNGHARHETWASTVPLAGAEVVETQGEEDVERVVG